MFISIVIPTYNDLNSLSQLIEKILNQTFLPKEIIIIDASTNNDIRNYVKNINTKIDIIFKSYFNYNGFSCGYPGQSRNIGIQLAQYDYVAFLDTKTFPEPDWLEFQINNLKDKNKDIIFGSTKFISTNLLQDLYYSSSYGNDIHETVPGSLGKTSFLSKYHFIENARAGEDLEWKNRIKFNSNLYCNSSSFLSYIDQNKNFFKSVK